MDGARRRSKKDLAQGSQAVQRGADLASRPADLPVEGIGAMQNFCARLAILLAIFLLGGFCLREAKAELVPLHVGHASVNSRMAPLWVAAQQGFFKKQGF